MRPVTGATPATAAAVMVGLRRCFSASAKRSRASSIELQRRQIRPIAQSLRDQSIYIRIERRRQRFIRQRKWLIAVVPHGGGKRAWLALASFSARNRSSSA